MTNWKRPLTAPLRDRAGTTLYTLADARAYILKLTPARQNSNAWQSAAGKLLAAAESGDTAPATRQLYLALFLDMQIDLTFGQAE